MLQRIRNWAVSIVGISLLALPVIVPAAAFAQSATPDINTNLKCGANLSTTECAVDTNDANSRINTLIGTVINIFSLVVGVVAVIMIIIGGLKYITSGGDAGNITGAKNTILYAIIGLVVVALAQFIVRFVLARATPA